MDFIVRDHDTFSFSFPFGVNMAAFKQTCTGGNASFARGAHVNVCGAFTWSSTRVSRKFPLLTTCKQSWLFSIWAGRRVSNWDSVPFVVSPRSAEQEVPSLSHSASIRLAPAQPHKVTMSLSELRFFTFSTVAERLTGDVGCKVSAHWIWFSVFNGRKTPGEPEPCFGPLDTKHEGQLFACFCASAISGCHLKLRQPCRTYLTLKVSPLDTY